MATDLSSERKYAEENYARIIQRLPPKLLAKEDGLLPKFQRHKGSPLRKLGLLFDFMDVLYGAVGPFLACKRGCSYCCHYEIALTEVEIAFIEEKTGYRRRTTAGPVPIYGQSCPFLKNDACSIYAARPFVCRKHVVLTRTSHWCHVDRANTEEFPLLTFSEVNNVFGHILVESGHTEPRDIRTIFDAGERVRR